MMNDECNSRFETKKMVLKGINNETAEIRLEGAEGNPSGIMIGRDAFLEVYVRLTKPGTEWSITDACLMVYEVQQIMKWMRSVALANEATEPLYFMEPNLSFHFLYYEDDAALFKISFSSGLTPPWAGTFQRCSCRSEASRPT